MGDDTTDVDTRDLYVAAMELCVNVGIMDAAINMPGRELPPHVQENWTEKVEGMIEQLQSATQEVQDFAEAFDDQ